MRTFWSISTVVFAISILYSYRINRKLITVPNIVFVSTTINFILYLQGWSADFYLECQGITYLVIGTVQIVFSVYALLNNKKKLEKKRKEYYLVKIAFGTVKFKLSTIMLFACIVLTMIETYYLTGTFISFKSTEAHTLSAPVIGTIVRGLFPVSYICAYLDWKKYKEKKTLLLVALCVAYSLLATGSRFWTIISLLTTCFFIVEYEKDLIELIPLRAKIGICVVSYFLFSVFIQLGMDRIGTKAYMDLISYTGPFRDTWAGNVLSWFYGYFPYSFHNLNLSLSHIKSSDICTFGQFTLYPFVSFLHIDGLLGIDYGAITSGSRIITNTAATVATGYFECYSDFRNLFIIGILILVGITWRYEKKRNLSGLIGFSAMETVWFLMSFNNNFTVGITLYVFFFAWIIRRFFTREYSEEVCE